jgi:hypothetical protein
VKQEELDCLPDLAFYTKRFAFWVGRRRYARLTGPDRKFVIKLIISRGYLLAAMRSKLVGSGHFVEFRSGFLKIFEIVIREARKAARSLRPQHLRISLLYPSLAFSVAG